TRASPAPLSYTDPSTPIASDGHSSSVSNARRTSFASTCPYSSLSPLVTTIAYDRAGASFASIPAHALSDPSARVSLQFTGAPSTRTCCFKLANDTRFDRCSDRYPRAAHLRCGVLVEHSIPLTSSGPYVANDAFVASPTGRGPSVPR